MVSVVCFHLAKGSSIVDDLLPCLQPLLSKRGVY